MIYCKAPLTVLQPATQGEIAHSKQTQTFGTYIQQQTNHIKCLLGMLKADKVDTEYWLKELNEGNVLIATNGSAA
eukprot:1990399-Ditylum_brightwellii.AAC.1